MIIPVRCFSCGRPVAQDWDEYDSRVQEGESPKDVLDSLGVSRYCCRRMLLTNVELIDDAMKFKRY